MPTAGPTNDLARTPAEEEPGEDPKWWMAVVVGLALLGGLGYLTLELRRARRARRAEEDAARRPQVTVGGGAAIPLPALADAPESAGEAGRSGDAPTFWTPSRPVAPLVRDDDPAEADAAPTPPTRPRLTMQFRPRRAGLNLVSATADVELTVRNEGDAPAEEIAVAIRLLAGRAGQEGELGALFAAEPGRPALPPFALAPGEERVCRTTVILPRAEIEPIVVADRPMFVPVITADLRYARPDGSRGQNAAAYVIGAVRAGGDNKLTPFWLDAAPRMRDEVEARPHGLAIDS